MKKTLLSAAVLALLAGTAHAETSVTLYGIIDTGLGYQRIKGDDLRASKFGMVNGVSSGSRWGLRGAEDLGDGLSAVFTLESGFNSLNGNMGQGRRLFGRQATVGLKSADWGQLDFGRQTNIASKYLSAIDPFGAGYSQANIGHLFSASNTVRYDNMVMYQTPSFSGFQVGAGYSFSADGLDTDAVGFKTADNTRAITAGVRYVNGPLNVAFSYDRFKPGHNSVSQGTNPSSWILGGSYDLEVVKLALAYGQTRSGWFQGQSINAFGAGETGAIGYPTFTTFDDDAKLRSALVGVSAPLGNAGNLMASWQHGWVSGEETKTDVFSVGYTYDLSKRTNFYAVASHAKNFAFQDDVTSSVGMVGVRHRF